MNTLFLQSDIADPYALYAEMRAGQPVVFDERNGIWAVYTHAMCKRVLENGTAHIPPLAAASLMNTASQTLTAHFARLANPPRHAEMRDAVMRLLACMKKVDAGELLVPLLGESGECDWVGAVCKKLPALAVMQSFGFSDADIDRVLPLMGPLTKLMLPHKTEAEAVAMNAAADVILALADEHLARHFPALAETEARRSMHACNLVGLLVQSVDAGRGILSNALLQAARLRAVKDWHGLVVETLRFDPPIHNTRRILTEPLELGEHLLPEGATVLVVLASANRDAEFFEDAGKFNMDRSNNAAHLTFGAGMHSCAAHRFATGLAVDALRALFHRRVELRQEEIACEPMVNARLPKEIRLRYSS
ncbi:cytochrome P450 [Noviherbaspirillum sp. ST9]|uniref:cytochrome P450 n=1 Tax=Noviherbaspirillum sp. ST9 TaxID=3401606 RepID=UPI003B588872